MPPRKKAATETAAEPERRSARIRDAPPKPKPIAPAPVPPKKPKKVDPELAEWKPSKKSATKKRKKADVDVEDGAGIADSQDKAEGDEDKPKKKSKTEPKEPKVLKGKKVTSEKAEDAKGGGIDTAVRTERRKSGIVNVQPVIEEGDESKVEDVLTIGSVIPKITLKNEKGEDIDVSTLVKGTGVVIFAAPKADTPGCNKQACHFRDSTEEFKKLGYAVYALTADAPAALTKWQAKNNLGYSLISDPKREFIHALGAKSGNSTKRSHFVFEKDTGKLLEATIGVKPDDSHAKALKFVKVL